ncbi:hypothetical protein [Lutimonas sp.]|uniref:hypothetical protein n=1 Tax=Lutimonas sp. TaxID=1872403 RepID=UPI003D9B3E2F
MNKSILSKNVALLILLLICSITGKLWAQEPVLVAGIVQSDSVKLPDIHILNLSTRKGTVSNLEGEFAITVSANDTLIFSGIQFHTLGIVIDREALKRRVIKVELKSRIEELSEIELKGHDLDGLFYIDTKRLNDSLPLMGEEAVNFSNQGYDDPTSSNYVVPSANLVNLVSMIGKKKRVERQKEANLLQQKRAATDNIRKDIGVDVFREQLGIPPQHIEPFIRYCQKKDIINLYVEGRIMEVIDILIKEKDNYIRERIQNQ